MFLFDKFDSAGQYKNQRFLLLVCRTSVLFATLILLFSGFIPQTSLASDSPSAAASNNSQQHLISCIPLDIVFVLDQSRYMEDKEAHLEAIWAAISDLTYITLNLCESTIYRIAVVSYGDEAEITLPLSLINPVDDMQSLTIQQALSQQVSRKNLGEANPLAGFQKAAEILDNAPMNIYEQRKRVIIFVTGSIPCTNCTVPNNSFDLADYLARFRLEINNMLPFGVTLRARETCLRTELQFESPSEFIEEEINTCYNDYQIGSLEYENSTYLYTIFLPTEESFREDIKSTYYAISDFHAGDLVDLSANPWGTPEIVRRMIERLSGVEMPSLTCGSFAMNPYLERATFVFYKASRDISVKISYRDFDGVEHVLQDGIATSGFELDEDGHQIFGANERYTISKPTPGIWYLSSDDCNNLDVYYGPINVYGLLNTPQIIHSQNSIPLELTLRHSRDNSIVEPYQNTIFAINVEAIVTSPIGDATTYNLVWDNSRKAFISSPVDYSIIGQYLVDIVATSIIREGEITLGHYGLYQQVFASRYTLFAEQSVVEVLEQREEERTPMLETPVIVASETESVTLAELDQEEISTPPSLQVDENNEISSWLDWSLLLLLAVGATIMMLVLARKVKKQGESYGQIATVHPTDPPIPSKKRIAMMLNNNFDLSDLRQICFEMGLDSENYSSTKRNFVRELIQDIERHNRKDELVAIMRQMRPFLFQ